MIGALTSRDGRSRRWRRSSAALLCRRRAAERGAQPRRQRDIVRLRAAAAVPCRRPRIAVSGATTSSSTGRRPGS